MQERHTFAGDSILIFFPSVLVWFGAFSFVFAAFWFPSTSPEDFLLVTPFCDLYLSVSFHLAPCPTAIYKGRETPPDKGNFLGNLLKSPAKNLAVSFNIHHFGSEAAMTNSPLAYQCV